MTTAEEQSIAAADKRAVGGEAVRVLVDGHGGDHAPEVAVKALKLALASRGQRCLELGIVGRREEIEPLLQVHGIEGDVELIPCSDVITMSDSPAQALRRKKDSSIHVAARLVRDRAWDALVSAGNTGALMAISKMILKTLPGIDRPAIASLLPSDDGGFTLLLDSGANTECTSDHLVQFAIMGSCYMQAAEHVEAPRVGLLNIGSENIKGTDVVKLAFSKLEASPLHFIGNVEGTDLFSDAVDVIVCDGFVGNVALKSIEGTAHFILKHMRDALSSSLIAKTGVLLAKPALKQFKDQVNPGRYNGAPLLGLNGIVVKSHGSADAAGFANAISVAYREVGEKLLDRITHTLQDILEE